MSASVELGIIGDGELNGPEKSEAHIPSVIARHIVNEIFDEAVEIVNRKAHVGDVDMDMDMDISSKKKQQDESQILKCSAELKNEQKGLGDQDEDSPSIHQPPVEKKNRLTDLVRNSKNIFSKYILNETRSRASLNAKEEKVLKVIDLECVQPATATSSLPDNERCCLEEVRLPTTMSSEDTKKTMTFPMTAGKLTLGQRYKTLKMNAEMKRKKWNWSGKVVNFIRKKNKKEEPKEE